MADRIGGSLRPFVDGTRPLDVEAEKILLEDRAFHALRPLPAASSNVATSSQMQQPLPNARKPMAVKRERAPSSPPSGSAPKKGKGKG
eukprot:6456434-Amphidinium_carterae.1